MEDFLRSPTKLGNSQLYSNELNHGDGGYDAVEGGEGVEDAILPHRGRVHVVPPIRSRRHLDGRDRRRPHPRSFSNPPTLVPSLSLYLSLSKLSNSRREVNKISTNCDRVKAPSTLESLPRKSLKSEDERGRRAQCRSSSLFPSSSSPVLPLSRFSSKKNFFFFQRSVFAGQ